MTISRTTRARGALLGLAVGDAIGTTVEFHERGTFEPVTDMVGGGPFQLQPGQWTDDTSMALCLADSLIECGGFDARDQMERYVRWAREGYRSSTGGFVDMGQTVGEALADFLKTGEPFSGPTAPDRAGNGCLMRLAPVPIYFTGDRERAVEMCGESSRTTHGAQECIDASRMFGGMIVDAIQGEPKLNLLAGCERSIVLDDASQKLQAIANGAYRKKSRVEIRGSGYVVECMEAALWCFERAKTYEEAVLLAVNLGDDADTTGAVCGQLAGAHWGEDGIPAAWRERVTAGAEIGDLAERMMGSQEGC